MPGLMGSDNVRTVVRPDISGVSDPVEAMIARMLTPAQLRERPRPKPLVSRLLFLDSCAWLIGAPGAFKSFVAIDLAAHVSLGKSWRGHAVHRGPVIYLAAEGAAGMTLRVEARQGGLWSVFVEACRRLGPALVVVDTQPRVTIGLSENDNGDMGYWAAQVDRVRALTGACVLIVHHTGLTTGRARGASALDGAQDTELKVERVRGSVSRARLCVDKQKDAAEIEPLDFMVREVTLGRDAETGEELSSLVLTQAEDTFLDAGGVEPAWRVRAVALYNLILERFQDSDGATRADLRSRFCALPLLDRLAAPTRIKAWDRAWADLLKRGLIARRYGAERFKLVMIEDQSSEGALTPNDGSAVPESGYNVVWPNDDAEFKDSRQT